MDIKLFGSEGLFDVPLYAFTWRMVWCWWVVEGGWGSMALTLISFKTTTKWNERTKRKKTL